MGSTMIRLSVLPSVSATISRTIRIRSLRVPASGSITPRVITSFIRTPSRDMIHTRIIPLSRPSALPFSLHRPHFASHHPSRSPPTLGYILAVDSFLIRTCHCARDCRWCLPLMPSLLSLSFNPEIIFLRVRPYLRGRPSPYMSGNRLDILLTEQLQSLQKAGMLVGGPIARASLLLLIGLRSTGARLVG